MFKTPLIKMGLLPLIDNFKMIKQIQVYLKEQKGSKFALLIYKY